MFHTELIPDWIWLLLVLGIAAVAAARFYARHRQAAFDRISAEIRERNIAEYKAWHRDQTKSAPPASQSPANNPPGR